MLIGTAHAVARAQHEALRAYGAGLVTQLRAAAVEDAGGGCR